MGMFDEVLVNPGLLPEELPEWCRSEGHQWQTKDLECAMNVYEIGEDGLLVLKGGIFIEKDEEDVVLENYHADLRLYTSNVSMSGPDRVAIREGDTPQFVTVIARFTNGKLDNIRVLGVDDTTRDREVIKR